MFDMLKLESKRIAKSPLFYIVVLWITYFVVSNLWLDMQEEIIKPIEGLESYGEHISTDIEVIKPNAVQSLILEYGTGSYSIYP